MDMLELYKLKELQSFIMQKFNGISSNLAILDFRHAIDNVIALESAIDMSVLLKFTSFQIFSLFR
jgi:hypothetical protein